MNLMKIFVRVMLFLDFLDFCIVQVILSCMIAAVSECHRHLHRRGIEQCQVLEER